MRPQGLEALAVRKTGFLPGEAEHQRLAGTIDIGIEQAHVRTLGCPCKRKICGDGGLADPTLARSDCDDILDLSERLEVPLYRVRVDLSRKLDLDGSAETLAP